MSSGLSRIEFFNKEIEALLGMFLLLEDPVDVIEANRHHLAHYFGELSTENQRAVLIFAEAHRISLLHSHLNIQQSLVVDLLESALERKSQLPKIGDLIEFYEESFLNDQEEIPLPNQLFTINNLTIKRSAPVRCRSPDP